MTEEEIGTQQEQRLEKKEGETTLKKTRGITERSLFSLLVVVVVANG